ncbi:MAG: CapA family protein [Tissierellia bacterium]|nr:CapA family protein [Tissierellia bacterium]
MLNSSDEKLSLKDKMTIVIKKQTKNFKLSIFCLIAVCVVTTFALIKKDDKSLAVADDQSISDTTFSFVGDIGFSRYVEEESKKEGYDHFFSRISDNFRNRDVVFANFESAIIDRNKEYQKPKGHIFLDAKDESLDAIKNAGIDLLSFSNNHSGDFGPKGTLDTIDVLKDQKINYIGIGKDVEDAKRPYEFEKDGVKYSIMAVTDSLKQGQSARKNKPGVLSTKSNEYLNCANKCSKNSDITIAYLHSGKEYTRKIEKKQEKVAHNLIDAGCDVIVGSHTHSILPIEKYKDGIIFYGIGNFIFDQGAASATDSMILDMDVDKDKNITFKAKPVKIKSGRPVISKSKLVNYRIERRLTKKA